jgi:hypothetical protein
MLFPSLNGLFQKVKVYFFGEVRVVLGVGLVMDNQCSHTNKNISP